MDWEIAVVLLVSFGAGALCSFVVWRVLDGEYRVMTAQLEAMLECERERREWADAEASRLRFECDRLFGSRVDRDQDGARRCPDCEYTGHLEDIIEEIKAERDAILEWSIRHAGYLGTRADGGWWARGDGGTVHADTARQAVRKAAGLDADAEEESDD